MAESEFFDDEQLDELQTIKLKEILFHAKESTTFYSNILSDTDIANFKLGQLKDLPIITKDILRIRNKEFRSSLYRKSSTIKSETSGSTGDAFVFYRDKQWDAAHRAAIWRGINQHNVEPWDRNLYLWGFVFTRFIKLKVGILDALQNRFRLFHIDTDEVEKNLNRISEVKFISGYSSVIDMLARLSVDINLSFPNIKLVKGTSERIYDSYQARALSVFGIPIVSEYGAAETGIISFTCPNGRNHTIRENVIVECVAGKAVVTNLDSFSMPIIRLDLGDYIELANQDCDCGRHTQVIQDVFGRVGASIVGAKKEYPSLTLYYIFKDLALRHGVSLAYQGYQHKKGHLTIRIFENQNDFDSLLVQKVAHKYLPDMAIDVEQAFLGKRNKKLRDFLSTIPVN